MAGDYSIGSDRWPGTSKVLEEMGELAQVLGKLIGNGGMTDHFDGSDLRQRLIEELADTAAAIDFFTSENLTTIEQVKISARFQEKLQWFRQWQEKGQ